MIPIDRIEVLNPRERNHRVFDDIVDNIKTIDRPEKAHHGHT
jgi:ParB family chromosome partitioning protein